MMRGAPLAITYEGVTSEETDSRSEQLNPSLGLALSQNSNLTQGHATFMLPEGNWHPNMSVGV